MEDKRNNEENIKTDKEITTEKETKINKIDQEQEIKDTKEETEIIEDEGVILKEELDDAKENTTAIASQETINQENLKQMSSSTNDIFIKIIDKKVIRVFGIIIGTVASLLLFFLLSDKLYLIKNFTTAQTLYYVCFIGSIITAVLAFICYGLKNNKDSEILTFGCIGSIMTITGIIVNNSITEIRLIHTAFKNYSTLFDYNIDDYLEEIIEYFGFKTPFSMYLMCIMGIVLLIITLLFMFNNNNTNIKINKEILKSKKTKIVMSILIAIIIAFVGYKVWDTYFNYEIIIY